MCRALVWEGKGTRTSQTAPSIGSQHLPLSQPPTANSQISPSPAQTQLIPGPTCEKLPNSRAGAAKDFRGSREGEQWLPPMESLSAQYSSVLFLQQFCWKSVNGFQELFLSQVRGRDTRTPNIFQAWGVTRAFYPSPHPNSKSLFCFMGCS